ncbi:BrnA antitoxin family protein [Magnetococcales bacterium HHB-1]
MSGKRSFLTSNTDYDALDAMTDADIDTEDLPPIPPEMFADALVRKGLKPVEPKRQITLRLDADVLEWFRSQGRGYQTQINAVLRAYKDAHKPV